MAKKNGRNRQIIIEWARNKINPMFGVYAACKQVYANGYQLDSNDAAYRRTYRLLEKMVSEGILMEHGTVNGGNVYMLRERDCKNGGLPQ